MPLSVPIENGARLMPAMEGLAVFSLEHCSTMPYYNAIAGMFWLSGQWPAKNMIAKHLQTFCC